MKKIFIGTVIGCFFYTLFLLKGGGDMVAVYVCLIIHGRRTFESVPERYKEAVKADLNAMGLDENGNPIEP